MIAFAFRDLKEHVIEVDLIRYFYKNTYVGYAAALGESIERPALSLVLAIPDSSILLQYLDEKMRDKDHEELWEFIRTMELDA